MAKIHKETPKPAEKERKDKKRKQAVIIHQNGEDAAEDDSVYDIEAQVEAQLDAETAQATPKANHAFKRARKDDGVDLANSNRPSKRTKKEAIVEPPKRVQKESLDTTKPSAVFKPKKGRDWTLSLALPGSFIANTKVIDQKNELAGRIARAAAVFCVDEVIIFDDAPTVIPKEWGVPKNDTRTRQQLLAEVPDNQEAWENPDQFLFHVLSYLECPAHLKKELFEEHFNLRGAGKLPPTDMPHSMKANEWCQYREGVTLSAAPASDKNCTLVHCGLPHPVKVKSSIPAGLRITLKFANSNPPKNWPNLSEQDCAKLDVEAVDASAPREEGGYYWGFSVRKADSLSSVYTESPYGTDGYDFSIGTSERGLPLASVIPNEDDRKKPYDDSSIKLPSEFKHLLVVVGGVTGLEPAVELDPVFREKGITKETASDAFDRWINLVPDQGSRTIRTEEAVWLALMGLHPYVSANGS